MRITTLSSIRATKLFAPLAFAVMMLSAGAPSAYAQFGLKTYTGAFQDGAKYLIEVPPDWNGTLFLYSHGYTTPETPNPPADNPDIVLRLFLLSHNYALAGSSYSSTGWAIQDALRDQIAVLDTFDSLVGHPTRTIAWGGSMGGAITALLVQNFPDRFDGAACFCGALAGSVGFWNQWLDSAFAFKILLAPESSLQVVHITDPIANASIALQLLSNAQATPQGQARIALVAALFDLFGWFNPTLPPPNPTDYATQEANQFASLSGQGGFDDFLFFFALRAELERRAGGNPSWNTGVDYQTQLKHSVDYAEVKALYQQAGLSLDADLKTLNGAARIPGDPAAVKYLSQFIHNGDLQIPMLTVHTIADDAVVVENEQAYAAAVHRAHNDSLLRQTFVHRAGHCAFTSAETLAALQALLRRLDTAEWQDLDPENLNAVARRFPRVYHSLGGGTAPFVSPSFIDYKPAPFLRPFDAAPQP